MDQWIKEGLSRILDFEVPDDLIQYILSIGNEGDLNEYMRTLLDFDNPHHKTFFLELSKRKFPGRGSSLPKQTKKKISKNKLAVEVPSEPTAPLATEGEGKGRKKTKYVNLYSQEGKSAQVVMLKGRHRCDCQASKHELVNNCVQCGRIVCTQEGSGPCLFCGNLVCTPQEQKELNAKTKASSKLMSSLMGQSRPEGCERAERHRDRLLEYDRTSERRTRVTDDDSDYFQAGSVWLAAGERERLQRYQAQLHDAKHASRLTKKITFDFAGRQIVEDNTIDYEVDEDKIRELTSSGAAGRGGARAQPGLHVGAAGERDVAPGVNAPLLQFDPSVESGSSPAGQGAGQGAGRVQDAALQEMSDTGRCLSMHQPWASLLVEGIKMHEGRSWYSSHRGRLWVASTAQPPDEHVVRALEHTYSARNPDKQLRFPSFYPAGCLLGCVTVDDCLPQEEYNKQYPGGESDSPYVFICSNPVSLRLRFPVRGRHKIYALDKGIHLAALKSIQRAAKLQAGEAHAG